MLIEKGKIWKVILSLVGVGRAGAGGGSGRGAGPAKRQGKARGRRLFISLIH